MAILIRFLVIGLVIFAVYYLLRPYLARFFRDPRMRGLLSGVGVNLLRLYLLRRAAPFIFRAIRSLFFFR